VYARRSNKPKKRLPVYERAITMAARRMRSVADMRARLLAEEYEEAEIEAALTRLKEVHLLDDTRVAQSITQQYKDKGNRYIAQKMKQKGLESDQHTTAIEELPDELIRAIEVAKKKLRYLEGLEPRKVQQKLYQHLAGRGFGSVTIQKVVRKVTGDAEFD
jgi:regulatory protein